MAAHALCCCALLQLRGIAAVLLVTAAAQLASPAAFTEGNLGIYSIYTQNYLEKQRNGLKNVAAVQWGHVSKAVLSCLSLGRRSRAHSWEWGWGL